MIPSSVKSCLNGKRKIIQIWVYLTFNKKWIGQGLSELWKEIPITVIFGFLIRRVI